MGELARRKLGHSGIEVSIIGLGCTNFGRRIDLERTRDVVEAAIGQGINFLDTADIYGDGRSEQLLGEVLYGRRQRIWDQAENRRHAQKALLEFLLSG